VEGTQLQGVLTAIADTRLIPCAPFWKAGPDELEKEANEKGKSVNETAEMVLCKKRMQRISLDDLL
jgi:hypothetical protein